jgi:uncharacterized protein
MRVIALEEHYATQRFFDGPGRGFVETANGPAGQLFPGGAHRLLAQLGDVADGRISEMDAAGVDVAVLSLTAPGLEQLPPDDAVPMARDTNDQLAEAIQPHATRLAGFAALPTANPVAAPDELERVVRDHGFVGALINGHCQGRRLDDEFFWPILERAEALGVPLYLHPTPPPQPVTELLYAGNYPQQVKPCCPPGGGDGTLRPQSMCCG